MEVDPYRATRSKKFIPKVMFMCDVCRPLFDVDGRVILNGNIRIWPFIEEVTTKRKSKKRPRGTKEKKSIQSITRQVIKKCIINEVKCVEFHECSSCKLEVILIELL